ncbi:MAG: hypothetical protein ACM3ZV_03785 [Bacillota bacterium]
MTTPRILELAVAVLLLAAGVVLYRRRDKTDSYGSQGAVLLMAIGVIVAIHALSLMEYHPSQAEAEMMMQRAR